MPSCTYLKNSHSIWLWNICKTEWFLEFTQYKWWIFGQSVSMTKKTEQNTGGFEGPGVHTQYQSYVFSLPIFQALMIIDDYKLFWDEIHLVDKNGLKMVIFYSSVHKEYRDCTRWKDPPCCDPWSNTVATTPGSGTTTFKFSYLKYWPPWWHVGHQGGQVQVIPAVPLHV